MRRILKKKLAMETDAPQSRPQPQAFSSKRQTVRLANAQTLGTIGINLLEVSQMFPAAPCQSPTDYSYARRGEQKRIQQTRRRGRRVNIFGVWEQQQRFDYALMLGSLTTQTYLKLMDWQAQTRRTATCYDRSPDCDCPRQCLGASRSSDPSTV